MKTNRITRFEADWLPYLIRAGLASRQDAIEARRRYAEGLARQMRERRDRRRREEDGC